MVKWRADLCYDVSPISQAAHVFRKGRINHVVVFLDDGHGMNIRTPQKNCRLKPLCEKYSGEEEISCKSEDVNRMTESLLGRRRGLLRPFSFKESATTSCMNAETVSTARMHSQSSRNAVDAITETPLEPCRG